MKYIFSRIIFVSLIISGFTFFSCNKVDYPAGLPQYDNAYYIGYLPWNNTSITVNRSQTTIIKFPIEFYSSFVRAYDAVIHYKADTAGIASPAIVGKDFVITDKNGNTLQPVGDSVYTITFPKAQKGYDTIYVKLLNNIVPGTRTINIDLVANQTSEYSVGIFSQAYRRPIKIN